MNRGKVIMTILGILHIVAIILTVFSIIIVFVVPIWELPEWLRTIVLIFTGGFRE